MRSVITPRVIRETSSRSSTRRTKCSIWRRMMPRISSTTWGSCELTSSTYRLLRIGARGLRSSCASITRNSSLRRSASASRSARSRSCRSSSRRALTSWKTRTTPRIRPSASRIGAPLSSIGRSVPSRETSTVWLASPTTSPSRRTWATGLSAGPRCCSLMIRKTSPSGRPTASARGQPVMASATGLRNVIRPWVSVAITASPMLVRTTRSHSRCSAASASARRRFSTSARSSATSWVSRRLLSSSSTAFSWSLSPRRRRCWRSNSSGGSAGAAGGRSRASSTASRIVCGSEGRARTVTPWSFVRSRTWSES